MFSQINLEDDQDVANFEKTQKIRGSDIKTRAEPYLEIDDVDPMNHSMMEPSHQRINSAQHPNSTRNANANKNTDFNQQDDYSREQYMKKQEQYIRMLENEKKIKEMETKGKAKTGDFTIGQTINSSPNKPVGQF